MGIEKVNAKVMTKEELLKAYGQGKDSLVENGQSKNFSVENVADSKGKFFAESQEIPKEDKIIIQKQFSSPTVNLRNVEFTESVSHDDNLSNPHFVYLDNHLSALKKDLAKEDKTIREKENVHFHPKVKTGDGTLNTVGKLKKLGSSGSDSYLEERDEIKNLNDFDSLKNINLKNDSIGIPSFGAFLQSSKLFSENCSQMSEDLIKERKKLFEKLEKLQKEEKDLDLRKKSMQEKEKAIFYRKAIYQKNKRILDLKQKLKKFIVLNKKLEDNEEGAYKKKLEELQKENILYKNLLKIASNPNQSSRNFLSENTSAANFSNSDRKYASASVNQNNNPPRTFKLDNRASVIINNEMIRSKDQSRNYFLKDVEITSYYKENVQRLKLCCLKSKGVLFKNEDIQIGILSDLQNFKDKKLIKFYLYLENISTNKVITNLFIQYRANDNVQLWVKMHQECISVLRCSEQKINEIIVDYKTIPFNFAVIDLKYQCIDKITRNIIALPNSILKLINFLELDVDELKNFWARYRDLSKKSEEFLIGQEFLENNNSLSKNTCFPFFFEYKNNKKKIKGFEKKCFYSKFLAFGEEGAAKLYLNSSENQNFYVATLKLFILDRETTLNKDITSVFLLNSIKFLLEKV